MGLNVGLFTCFVHVAPIASRLYTILPVRPWSGNEDQLSIYLLLSAVDYGILVHLVGLAWRCELHHRHSGGRQFHSVVWISNWQSDSRWLSQRNRRNNSLRSRASQDDSGRNWSMNPSIAGPCNGGNGCAGWACDTFSHWSNTASTPGVTPATSVCNARVCLRRSPTRAVRLVAH